MRRRRRWRRRLARLLERCGLRRRDAAPRGWRLDAPRLERRGAAWRVTAQAAGEPIWFECADTPLARSAEAFAGILLLPALARGAQVEVEPPLDPAWLAATRRLPPIYAGWWGYPARYPLQAQPAPAPSVSGPDATAAGPGPTTAGIDAIAAGPAPGVGQCFTGGVDSFDTLLSGRHPVTHLVFVHGYDIGLDDDRRMAAFEPDLRRVAAAAGCAAVVIRTNLRAHRAFASVSWERTHGAALAAVGQLLAPAIGRLVIPSSYSSADETPWGSHWLTDPCWSSARVAIAHDDPSLARHEKVRGVAAHPLSHDSLRVCWENHAPTGNCSACEKCVRTMVALASWGVLDRYRVFDRTVPLPDRVDALPAAAAPLLPIWRAMRRPALSPPVRAAVDRLLRRSQS